MTNENTAPPTMQSPLYEINKSGLLLQQFRNDHCATGPARLKARAAKSEMLAMHSRHRESGCYLDPTLLWSSPPLCSCSE